MNNWNSFDMDFERNFRFVTGMIKTIFVIIVVGIIAVCLVAGFAVKDIKQNGLKSVIEKVWNGEGGER